MYKHILIINISEKRHIKFYIANMDVSVLKNYSELIYKLN